METPFSPFPNVFAKRRVFITGHTGFKGSWLTVWLHLLGAEITGFSLPPQRGNDHFEELGLRRMIRHIEGDVRDAAALTEAMGKSRPEFVFHLAAQPLVRRSYRDPKMTFDTNIGGSVNLLEAVRSVGSVRVLIYVTSDKCYRPRERARGFKETDPLGGHDPYSTSKACAELILSSYQSSFFEGSKVSAASVRAGNIIGGGDWSEDRIVPDCIRALSAGRAIPVRNPDAVRPWQHVLEPIGGYLRLATFLRSAQGADYRGGWNFGPSQDSHRPVQDLVDAAITNWGGGRIESVQPVAGRGTFAETKTLYLNCDKASQVLDWHPTWDFHQSVARTVEWYKLALGGADVWKLTTWQLHAYCAMSRTGRVVEGPAA